MDRFGTRIFCISILVYWAVFLSFFFYSAFWAPPSLSIPDSFFLVLLTIYLSCFPVMLVLSLGCLKNDRAFARTCLIITIVLGVLTILGRPQVVA